MAAHRPVSADRNPFLQHAAHYALVFIVPYRLVQALEEAFADMALSIASFEVEGQRTTSRQPAAAQSKLLPSELLNTPDDAPWWVEVIVAGKPNRAELVARLSLMKAMSGAEVALPAMHEVEQKNWAAEVQKYFPPLRVGRFFIHGSHYRQAPPHSALALQVDAGAAFGSGEHATTSGCLLALTKLARQRRFTNVLDMGTGSGILAMAAAKLWKAPVLAVDIDEVSVRVTRENIRDNRLTKWIRAEQGDGYLSRAVEAHGPYDLIVSNILAAPLTRFAKYAKRQLARRGVLVLSGLLADQEAMVLSAHAMQGLHLQRRIAIHGWHTLVVGR